MPDAIHALVYVQPLPCLLVCSAVVLWKHCAVRTHAVLYVLQGGVGQNVLSLQCMSAKLCVHGVP